MIERKLLIDTLQSAISVAESTVVSVKLSSLLLDLLESGRYNRANKEDLITLINAPLDINNDLDTNVDVLLNLKW